MAGFSNAVYREIFKNETKGKEDSEMIVFYRIGFTKRPTGCYIYCLKLNLIKSK